jgi:hypothetical protein
MNNRILDFSDRPARLSVRNGLLVIDFRSAALQGGTPDAGLKPGATEGENAKDTEEPLRSPPGQAPTAATEETYTVPLSDIAVVIASHPQISYTHAVLAGLAEAGGMFIACDGRHMPIAMLLPLARISH